MVVFILLFSGQTWHLCAKQRLWRGKESRTAEVFAARASGLVASRFSCSGRVVSGPMRLPETNIPPAGWEHILHWAKPEGREEQLPQVLGIPSLTQAPRVLLTDPGCHRCFPEPRATPEQSLCRSHGHLQPWFKLHDSFPFMSLQVP